MIIDMNRYAPDPNMSGIRLVADMLDWAAQQHPYMTVGYNEIFAKIHGLRMIPKMDAPEVLRWSKAVYGAGQVLEDRYERALVTEPKMHGCRATADAGEYLRAIRKKAEVFIRGGARVARMHAKFDLTKVPAGKGYEEDLAWYHQFFHPALQEMQKPVLKMLSTPPRRALSMPPKKIVKMVR